MKLCPWNQEEHDFSYTINIPEKQGWVTTCVNCGWIEGEQA